MRNVLAIFLNHIASTEINVVLPLRELHQRGAVHFEVALEELVRPEQVAAADVIVACRNIDPLYRPIFELAQQLQIPWIYDLDDNLWDVPKEEGHSAYYHHPARQAMLNWMVSNACRVRVHSPRLAEIVRAHNPNVQVVHAAVDWSLVPPALPELPEDHIHIVYATSRRAGDILFGQIKGDLLQLLERGDKRIKLHLMGTNPEELRHFPQVVYHPYSDHYEAWFREFTRFGYAIGLAPMLTDDFHECKTDTKFRDYAAAGAVGIYQDSALYRGSVVDGETGLFVSGEPGSWVRAVDRLMNDRALLSRIRDNAAQFVRERNNLEQAAASWLEDIHSAPARPPVPDGWQPPKWDFTITTAHWRYRFRPYFRRILPPRLRVGLRNVLLQWHLLRHRP